MTRADLEPVVKVRHWVVSPGHLGQEVVHHVRVVDPLHGHPRAHHARVGQGPGLRRPPIDTLSPAKHRHLSAKCVDHVEDEGLAVI